MIETLRITQLAIVEELELELGPGLNVLTGETGAGKSIVLGALGLLAGARASAGVVRAGCDQGVVEAVFRTDAVPEFERELEARGYPVEEHELIVRRSVSRNGRSRCRLADQLAPASVLAELFGSRIEISSQHGSQALLQAAEQTQLLDASGGLTDDRRALAGACQRLRALDAEIETLSSEAEERVRRQDFLAFQRDEIDAANLEPGDLEAAVAEHGRLAHALRLREEGGAVCAGLLGDPAGSPVPGATDQIAAALRLLEGLARLDPELAAPLERLTEFEAELRDLGVELERYVDRLEVDPARLARLEERLAQLDRLRRKYGDSVEQILAHRDRVVAELADIGGADDRAELLERDRRERVTALTASAGRLSEGRRAAAERLGSSVQRRLADLLLPKARFEVALLPQSPPAGLPSGPSGNEVVELRFAANTGEPLRPLQKVVSGGELSRLFLAVKGALRGAKRGMVLIFDEVDSGVGGGAAERVGRSLAELTAHHQVLCITHLPQIAALADVHFRVEKVERDGRTTTLISRLAGDRRIDEIARMAGGESVGPATRRHAEELLRAALAG